MDFRAIEEGTNRKGYFGRKCLLDWPIVKRVTDCPKSEGLLVICRFGSLRDQLFGRELDS